MQSGAPPLATLNAYTATLEAAASDARAAAADARHRAGDALRLGARAAAADAEAGTWRLLACLHGETDAAWPAGGGGASVPRAGGSRTTAQTAAEAVSSDPSLNAVARVVAWLEALAARDLDAADACATAAGGGGDLIADGEAAPRESKVRAARAGGGSAQTTTPPLVSDLDPDASTRQHAAWAPADADARARLCARLRALVRCGRLHAARALAARAGAPWLAAALGEAAGPGLLPVGEAAAAADAAPPPRRRAVCRG